MSDNTSNSLRWILAILALASLCAATVLQLRGIDASKAWDGFIASVTGLIGVHVPAPTR